MTGAYDWIGREYRDLASSQAYDSSPTIEGVQVVDLRLFSDDGGDFCEIARLAADGSLVAFPGYRPEQLSYALMEPRTIKAWHLHRDQDDLWFVPPHQRLIAGLLDVRESSASYRATMRFVLGADQAKLVLVPRGVAHGVANPGQHAATLLYLTNRQFNAAHPDEHRLPWDLLGSEFWRVQLG